MISTADFKTGMTVELDDKLYEIISFQHAKLGRGGAYVKTKLKELKSGYVSDKTFRAGEKVNQAILEEKKMEYLYGEDNLFYFMDVANYEQLTISEAELGEVAKYLKENMVVNALMHRGSLVGVKLPQFVELTVAKTEPGLRGDRVSGGSKPATLETGAVLQVPLFIDKGDLVRVNTRTGEYMERA